MVASEFAEKIAKVKTALENVFLKKNLGSGNGGKNVVTNANGDIITEAKPTIPSASTTVPSADTTSGSYGSGTSYARSNHIHPKSSLYAEANHGHEYLTQTQLLPTADLNDEIYRSPGLYAITGAVSQTLANRPFPDTYLKNDVTKFSWLKIEQYKNGNILRHVQIYYSMNTGYEHIFYRTSTSNGWNSWKKIANIDEIPTKVSDLTNDSGFLTSHQSLTNYIQKSNTSGLVKNDGTIDTSSYVKNNDSRLTDARVPVCIGIVADTDNRVDLNNYNDVGGFYYCKKTTYANYIMNCPNSIGTNLTNDLPKSNNKAFFLLVETWGTTTTYTKQTLTYHDTGITYVRTQIQGNWQPWKQIADTNQIPTKVSDLTNDSGFTSYTHPSGIGTALTTATLKKIKYDAQGHITGVADAPTASTSASGIVQLNDNINSTSTTQAATANAIKKTYDEFSGSSTTKNAHTHSYAELTNKPSYTPTITSSTTDAYEIGSININGSDVTIYGKDTDTNTNTIGYQLRTNNTALTASDKTYRYRLLLEVEDGTYMPVNTSTSTSATANKSSTMNTREFMLGGDIRLYNATTAINANATFSATVLWQQYNMNLGYSFNNTGSALTLTVNSPIYMIAKQSSSNPSKATLNTPYFTQTLPNTEDGLLYIQLGYATSETQIELTLHHPIYEYKNGGIQKFSLNTHTHVPTSYKYTNITTTGGYFSDSCFIQFYKINNVVIAQFRVLTGTQNLTTSYNNFVPEYGIPEAYRPIEEVISLNHCAFNTTTPSIVTTRITTNGLVEMRINTDVRYVNTYYTVIYTTTE